MHFIVVISQEPRLLFTKCRCQFWSSNFVTLPLAIFFAISILIYTYFHKDYLFPIFQLGIETVEINTLMDRCDFVDASLPSSPPAGATCPAVDASGPCAGVACRFGSSSTIVALMVIWPMTFYHIAWRIFVIAFSYEHLTPDHLTNPVFDQDLWAAVFLFHYLSR